MNQYPEQASIIQKGALPLAAVLLLSGCVQFRPSAQDAENNPHPSPAASANANHEPTQEPLATADSSLPAHCQDLKKNGFVVAETGSKQSVTALAAKYHILDTTIQTFSEQAGLSKKDTTDACVTIPISTVAKLTDQEFKAMDGYSWRQGCLPSKDSLRHVNVPYRTYDNKSAVGSLIVSSTIAAKTANIFSTIYTTTDFQIKSIKPIEAIVGKASKTNDLDKATKFDDLSMEQNNTSGFNCRNAVSADKKVSTHGKGLAIDINPVENPYIFDGKLYPDNADPDADRSAHVPGLISKDDAAGKAVINIFKKQGFAWGGNNKTDMDYQHFAYSSEELTG